MVLSRGERQKQHVVIVVIRPVIVDVDQFITSSLLTKSVTDCLFVKESDWIKLVQVFKAITMSERYPLRDNEKHVRVCRFVL